MRRLASALRTIFGALRAAASDLGRELTRLNNVAEVCSSCKTARAVRVGKVKEWMLRRSGDSARCC